MTWRYDVEGPCGRLCLSHWADADSEEALRLDRDEAASLLRGCTDDWFAASALRALLEDELAVRTSGLSDERVIDELALRIASGQICVSRRFHALPALPPAIAAPSEPRTVEPKQKPDKKPEVTVKIRAENGVDDPPTSVAVKGRVRLKGVPSRGTGSHRWRTASRRIALEDESAETVTVVAKKRPSTATEEIELVFTPAGKPALPPVKHNLRVGTVLFRRQPSHAWGYDAYERIPSVDMHRRRTSPLPGPNIDFLSIKKGQLGKIKVAILGVDPEEVYLTSSQASVCTPKIARAVRNQFVLEIEAKGASKSEARIEARVGSANGQVLAEVGVVVLEEAKYRATLFRVHDSRSPKTALTTPVTAVAAQSYANRVYEAGVAVWEVREGGRRGLGGERGRDQGRAVRREPQRLARPRAGNAR